VRVGVLALQGDWAAHRAALARFGLTVSEVRTAAELVGVDGLVLPGGESTTMLTLMAGNGLAGKLREVAKSGCPVLATCAGVILLAREVRGPSQPSLGLLDVTVERNAYGRQIDSTVTALAVELPEELGAATIEGVFIRAPRVVATGPGVRVIARRGSDPVLLRQGNLLAATFHPELSEDSPVIDLFTRLVGGWR
jgi:5'-phosphate synthase pdxT subunit